MKKGYFGDFGGQFIPELLMPPLIELEEAMETILPSEEFQTRFTNMLKENVGRPSAITYCPNLSKDLGLDLGVAHERPQGSGIDRVEGVEPVAHRPGGKRGPLARWRGGAHL